MYSICSKRFRRGFLDLINKRRNSDSKQHDAVIQAAGNETTFKGNTRRKNRKKVVSKKALLRHFDDPLLSPEDNYAHLERDKVILFRNKSKQLTILKKCKSLGNCKQNNSKTDQS